MFGITVSVARENGYTGPMRSLPRTLAEDIYRRRYWDSLKLDDIAVLSNPIAAELADTGVNLGVPTAARFLQRLLNVFNQQGTLYPDVKVDGVCGAGTVAALRSYLTARRSDGEIVLLRALNGLQAAHYIALAENRAKDEAFVYGWIRNRVAI